MLERQEDDLRLRKLVQAATAIVVQKESCVDKECDSGRLVMKSGMLLRIDYQQM